MLIFVQHTDDGKQYFLEPEHAAQKRYEASYFSFSSIVVQQRNWRKVCYTYQFFRMLCTMFRKRNAEFFKELTKFGTNQTTTTI